MSGTNIFYIWQDAARILPQDEGVGTKDGVVEREHCVIGGFIRTNDDSSCK